MHRELPFDDEQTVLGLGDAVMVQLEGKGQDRMREWLALERRQRKPARP